MRAREGGESDQKNRDLYLFKRKKKTNNRRFHTLTQSNTYPPLPLSCPSLPSRVWRENIQCVCVFCNGNSVGLAALLPPIIIVALSPSCVRCTLTLSLTSVTTKESERRTISHTWWFCVFVCVCAIKDYCEITTTMNPFPPPPPKCVCV